MAYCQLVCVWQLMRRSADITDCSIRGDVMLSHNWADLRAGPGWRTNLLLSERHIRVSGIRLLVNAALS
jgi:hypothetical protein